MKKYLKVFSMVLVVGSLGMMLFGINGYAYIDPSVTTYLIQAIAGVIIAVGAVAGVYIRKVRKKINEKLNIDENRNKEVESDEIIINKGGNDDI